MTTPGYVESIKELRTEIARAHGRIQIMTQILDQMANNQADIARRLRSLEEMPEAQNRP